MHSDDDHAPTGAQAQIAFAKPANERVRMLGIVKRFPTATALDDVSLTVRAGEIHALLGENGAGKSTLMHILSGLTQPDSGQIEIDGRQVEISSPREARTLSIAMVHQHFTLVPAFTVEENLALDRPDTLNQWNYSAATAAAPALRRAADFGWKLRADARVADLPVGVQQRVEIVKALSTGAAIVIFDEPTAVLTAGEVEELFSVLRRLRDQGNAVVLIAHKLAEILAVADRVTVLRRGRNVATAEIAATSALQLAAWMVGEPLEAASTPATDKDAAAPAPHLHQMIAAFAALNITVRGDQGEIAIDGLSIDVGRGEIYGVGGVDGNGQNELAEALAGLRRIESGSMSWDGRMFFGKQRPTIGYIPQDRRRNGLAVTLSIEDNLLFSAVRSPEFRVGPFLRRSALRQLARRLVHEFDIRTPTPTSSASSLSGGNQQKIVVARALHNRPEWIVAVNPTRGLDIGSTRFVHEQLRLARTRGAAIVLISTDLDELKLLADRGAILSRGKLTDYEFGSDNAERLGMLLGGAYVQAADTEPAT